MIGKWLRLAGLEPYFILWQDSFAEGAAAPADTLLMDKKSANWLGVPKPETLSQLQAREYRFVIAVDIPEDHPLKAVALHARTKMTVWSGRGKVPENYSFVYLSPIADLSPDKHLTSLFHYLEKIIL